MGTATRKCKNAKNPKPPWPYLVVHYCYMELVFNFILYQTLGPKLIAHFVGMHVGMN
jgi:hypothetical protein